MMTASNAVGYTQVGFHANWGSSIVHFYQSYDGSATFLIRT